MLYLGTPHLSLLSAPAGLYAVAVSLCVHDFSVKVLHLDRNNIGDTGARALADALPQAANLRDSRLNLCISGLGHICRAGCLLIGVKAPTGKIEGK